MTEIVVGARLDLKTNTLLPAVEATQAQFAKLEETAKKADAAVDKVVGQSGKKPPIDLFGPGKGGDDLAAEIAKVESALARYLGRLDPAARAVKTQVEGQTLLSRALELGIINQTQYEQGMARVTKAAEQQLLTKQNLLKGHLDLHQSLRVGVSLLAGFAGGLAGSLAAMAAQEIGSAALDAAYKLLFTEADRVARIHKQLNDLLDQGARSSDAAVRSSRERAAQYNAETGNLLALSRAKLEELKLDLARRESESRRIGAGKLPEGWFQKEKEDIALAEARLRALDEQRGRRQTHSGVGDLVDENLQLQMQLDIRRRGRSAMREQAIAFEYENELRKRGIALGTDEARVLKEQIARRYDLRTELETSKSRGRKGLTDGEKDLLKQAEAAIKAKRALDEYAEASQDIIEKAEAELSGRRELIAQIELEAQLRKRYGVEFVEQNRERIAALAQERAAAQRVADQYKATAQFFENIAGQIGNVIEATLVLSWDRSEDAIKSWENTLLSSLRQVQAELTRLAIVNPLINAMTGNSKLPTAYGQGGIVDVVLGLLGLGGAGANDRIEAGIRHDGGRVGAAGPTRFVPREIFAAVPRAHDGLYLAPGERPVIARDEETIFTPRQLDNAGGMMRALTALASQRVAGGEAPVINIIDQRGQGGAPIETRRRRGAGGRLEIDVIVKDAVKRALGDGSMDRTMEANYGIPRRGVRGGGV